MDFGMRHRNDVSKIKYIHLKNLYKDTFYIVICQMKIELNGEIEYTAVYIHLSCVRTSKRIY